MLWTDTKSEVEGFIQSVFFNLASAVGIFAATPTMKPNYQYPLGLFFWPPFALLTNSKAYTLPP